MQRKLTVAFILGMFSYCASGQANGKLQLHFMNVGQGDSVLLISPQGQTVLFDAVKDAKRQDCERPVSYLDQLGIKQIDYLFVSHYHSDHIGCIPDVLEQFPLQHDAVDRGQQYPGPTYEGYISAVHAHRKAGWPGMMVRLDQDTTNPVVITVIALNGTGVATTNENDLSLKCIKISKRRSHPKSAESMSTKFTITGVPTALMTRGS